METRTKFLQKTSTMFSFNLNPIWEFHNWAPMHFEFDINGKQLI